MIWSDTTLTRKIVIALDKVDYVYINYIQNDADVYVNGKLITLTGKEIVQSFFSAFVEYKTK